MEHDEYQEVSVSFTASELHELVRELAQAMWPKIHYSPIPVDMANETIASSRYHLNKARMIIENRLPDLDWTNP